MLSIPPNGSGAASMAPIDGTASSGLCILPNLEMNRINFPHEKETDGTLILGKTVRTIVRVGRLPGLPPTASKRLIMSLHDGSGEITANRVTTGKSMYNDSSNALMQEMRPEVPPQPDLSSGFVHPAQPRDEPHQFPARERDRRNPHPGQDGEDNRACRASPWPAPDSF